MPVPPNKFLTSVAGAGVVLAPKRFLVSVAGVTPLVVPKRPLVSGLAASAAGAIEPKLKIEAAGLVSVLPNATFFVAGSSAPGGLVALPKELDVAGFDALVPKNDEAEACVVCVSAAAGLVKRLVGCVVGGSLATGALPNSVFDWNTEGLEASVVAGSAGLVLKREEGACVVSLDSCLSFAWPKRGVLAPELKSEFVTAGSGAEGAEVPKKEGLEAAVSVVFVPNENSEVAGALGASVTGSSAFLEGTPKRLLGAES